MLYWLFRNKIARRVLILFLFVLLLLYFMDRYYSQTVKLYTSQKATLHGTVLVENAIRENVLTTLDMEELVYIKNDSYGNVESITLNTVQANQILADVSKNLYTYIDDSTSSKDMTNLSVPFGLIISDIFLTELGPSIDIKLRQVGSVKTDIVSSATPFGINNSIIEVNLVTKVTFAAIIPLNEQTVEVECKIPILVEIINGEIPKYYYSTDKDATPKTPSEEDLDDIDEIDLDLS